MLNLEKIFLRVTFSLVVVGFYSLLLTEQLSTGLSIICLAIIPFAYFNEQREKPFRIPVGLLNAVALGTLFYQAYLSLYGAKLLIWGAIDFLVILQIIRLVSSKQDRDYLQIFGLSLLHLIGACVLTASVQFALVFFIYIVIGTWALSLFNLRRELRLAGRMDILDQVVTKKFFVLQSLLAVFVFICSIVLFAFFPRLNYSYFAGAIQRDNPSSGFNNEVKLGQTGQIKLNQRPVLRLSLSGPASSEIKASDLYLRGAVLSFYDGQGWKNPLILNQQMLSNQFNRKNFIRPFSEDDANLIQEIVLEPIGIDSLFGMEKMIGIEGPMGVISYRDGQNFTASFAGSQRFKYTVYSKYQRSNIANSRGEDFSLGEFPKRDLTNVLQVPMDLNPDIVLLARQITANAKSDVDRAGDIERYLKTKLSYSLEMTDPKGEDPISFFLLKSQKGHCEYFASSMALMLRSLGIPTRLVSGYYHGEYNSVGRYYLFRESHAHTWVEVFFPKTGWQPFDPTPADPSLGNPLSFRERANQLYDSVELMWVNWVVDYSFEQQRSAFVSLTPKHKLFKNDSEKATEEIKNEIRKNIFNNPVVMYWFMGACALGLMVYLGYRLGGEKKLRGQKQSHLFYGKMLNLLAKKGFARAKEMTPREFAEAMTGKVDPAVLQVVHNLTEAFCLAKYADQKPENLEKWATPQIKWLRRALAHQQPRAET